MHLRRIASSGAAVVAVAVLGLTAGVARAGEPVKTSDGYTELTVDQVASLITSKQLQVIDTNSHERYVKSHVATAKWLPFDSFAASDLPKDKGAHLLFYCANPH